MAGPIIHRTGRGMVLRRVLRRMLRVAGTLLGVAEQVQGPEDPVAQKQRDDEHQGLLSEAERLHRRSLLDVGDGCMINLVAAVIDS
jgi:alanyl-tRNA synthetase